MPTSGDTCEIADSLLLDALDPCRRAECLSGGSVAGAVPAVGRMCTALVAERDHVPSRRSRTGITLREPVPQGLG